MSPIRYFSFISAAAFIKTVLVILIVSILFSLLDIGFDMGHISVIIISSFIADLLAISFLKYFKEKG